MASYIPWKSLSEGFIAGGLFQNLSFFRSIRALSLEIFLREDQRNCTNTLSFVSFIYRIKNKKSVIRIFCWVRHVQSRSFPSVCEVARKAVSTRVGRERGIPEHVARLSRPGLPRSCIRNCATNPARIVPSRFFHRDQSMIPIQPCLSPIGPAVLCPPSSSRWN